MTSYVVVSCKRSKKQVFLICINLELLKIIVRLVLFKIKSSKQPIHFTNFRIFFAHANFRISREPKSHV